MAQYIDKSAVVAEIERLKTIYKDDENIHHIAKYNILVDILSFLDTLEVKEVDIKKEVMKFMVSDVCQLGEENGCIIVAKHFFELGLRAQKGE